MSNEAFFFFLLSFFNDTCNFSQQLNFVSIEQKLTIYPIHLQPLVFLDLPNSVPSDKVMQQGLNSMSLFQTHLNKESVNIAFYKFYHTFHLNIFYLPN